MSDADKERMASGVATGLAQYRALTEGGGGTAKC